MSRIIAHKAASPKTILSKTIPSSITFGLTLALAALPLLAAPAFADADDAAWIKRCVADNKDEGATATVVAAYCSCMNNKMSANETLSITAWEKKHPAEQAACSKEAGWK